MRRLIPASLIVLALAAVGCGGSGSTPPSGGGEVSDDQAQVFSEKCGSCHTLAAADASGSFGPNLDDVQPTAAETLAAIEAGPATMPPNLVRGAEARALSDYVADSAGGS